MRTWARYVRVSALMGRSGDAFLSPELQEQAITRLISQTDGKAGPLFTDIDRTGTDFNRDGIQSALAWVMEKPSSRGLATFDVSRLGRNTSESLEVVKRLRKAGAVYASAQEKIDDTPEGNLALTMWLGMAEHHSAKIGATWRSVHEHRAKRGLHHGAVPLGYTKDGRDAVIDPDSADAVIEVFEMYARGVTVKQVAARLGELRGVHVPTQNAKRMLRSEFYAGKVKFRGEWVDGAHDALISPELWARVQQRLQAEAGQPTRLASPTTPLQGLLRCGGCGGTVTVVNGGTAVSCTQFRKRYEKDRTCAGIGAPKIADLESRVIEYLQDWCWGQHTHEEFDTTTQDRAQKRVDRLERDLQVAVEGRTRLTLALAKGRISDEAFDDAMTALERDIKELTTNLESARSTLVLAPASDEERIARVLEIAEVMRDLPPSEGRERLRREIEAVVIHRIKNERKPFARWNGGIEVIFR